MADIKIADLNLGTALGANDAVVLVQGNTTLKVKGQDIAWGIKTLANLADKAYVDAIVAGAPELLDTLNELAAAIGDDPNFASSIRTILDSKLPTVNFGLEFWNAMAEVTTFHVAEDTNLYYTEQRVLDVVIPLVPTSIFDLDVPEVSVNLPGYLHYNGTTLSWKSSTNPTYDTVTILAEPTSLLHAATKGYVDSQFDSFESFSGSYNDLTDKPTAPTFNSVTTTDLNTQNVNFTGTGAVNITSGNDLNLTAAGDIFFNGERTISLTRLKTVVAASTDFANFKSRIAAL